MKIVNGQVRDVLPALVAVMRGAILPVKDACDCADAIIGLRAAQQKILLLEQPIFAGRTTITTDDDPDAMVRLAEIRDIECDVDIPIHTLAVVTKSAGTANPVDLALLMEVGIIERDNA